LTAPSSSDIETLQARVALLERQNAALKERNKSNREAVESLRILAKGCLASFIEEAEPPTDDERERLQKTMDDIHELGMLRVRVAELEDLLDAR
jgi:hypothetical protein